ncbi:MAG: O-antigen ligase family protein, partial [Pseudomonadota bacterium]
MTHAAMLAFPLVAWLFFVRLPFATAIVASMLLGFLFLPSAYSISIPVLPNLDRATLPLLVTLGLALVYGARRDGPHRPEVAMGDPPTILPGFFPKIGGAHIFAGIALLGSVGTWFANTGPLIVAETVRQGLTLYDVLNEIQQLILWFLTLVLGWKFLADEKAQQTILMLMAGAVLGYSLLTLVEVRLAPQLHIWVYGYFPHDFLQHIRGGSFRPVVFMPHGLVLSLFLCMSALAIVAYMRAIDGDRRVLYFFAFCWVLVVLLLSRSLGAVLIAMLIVPSLFLFNARWQTFVAAAIAFLVVAYPVARAVGISPLTRVAAAVEPYAQSRANSLNFRLENEEDVIAHTAAKPLFGWGGYNRGAVYSETGRSISVRDGFWLVQYSQSGWFGYVGIFGLLTLGVFGLAVRAIRRPPSLAASGLCLVLAANLMDLIPNSGLTSLTWLIAGSLLGRWQ